MSKEQMKSIIVLKNLPSNFIEEAIVVVRDGKKVKNPEYKVMQSFMSEKDLGNIEQIKREKRQYVVKEAELIIKGYIEEIDSKRKSKNMNKMTAKYRKINIINYFLALVTFMSLIVAFVK